MLSQKKKSCMTGKKGVREKRIERPRKKIRWSKKAEGKREKKKKRR